MNTIWNNIKNWSIEYFFVPIALFFIWLSVEIHYFMTGRPVADDPWAWLPEFAPRLFAAIMSIVLVSLTREATGVWLSKEDKLANPVYASVQTICSALLLVAFLFFLSR